MWLCVRIWIVVKTAVRCLIIKGAIHCFKSTRWIDKSAVCGFNPNVAHWCLTWSSRLGVIDPMRLKCLYILHLCTRFATTWASIFIRNDCLASRAYSGNVFLFVLFTVYYPALFSDLLRPSSLDCCRFQPAAWTSWFSQHSLKTDLLKQFWLRKDEESNAPYSTWHYSFILFLYEPICLLCEPWCS